MSSFEPTTFRIQAIFRALGLLNDVSKLILSLVNIKVPLLQQQQQQQQQETFSNNKKDENRENFDTQGTGCD